MVLAARASAASLTGNMGNELCLGHEGDTSDVQPCSGPLAMSLQPVSVSWLGFNQSLLPCQCCVFLVSAPLQACELRLRGRPQLQAAASHRNRLCGAME